MTGGAIIIIIIESPVLLRSSREESGQWVQEKEEDVMPYSGLFYFI